MTPEDRIKENVYAGKVLDEHGNWITLVEKLKKERVFQKHLEKGEMLSNGKWTHVSKIKLQQEHLFSENLSIDPEAVVEEETTILSVTKIHKEQPSQHSAPRETREEMEETVPIAMDTEHDYTIDETDDDDDFPAETTVFKIDRTGDAIKIEFPETSVKQTDASLVNGETQMDFPIDTFKAAQHDSVDETEFQETVLYNINVLKKEDGRKVDASAAVDSSHSRKSAFHESIQQSHKAELDKLKKKNRLTAGLIVLLAAVLIAFLLLKNLL